MRKIVLREKSQIRENYIALNCISQNLRMMTKKASLSFVRKKKERKKGHLQILKKDKQTMKEKKNKNELPVDPVGQLGFCGVRIKPRATKIKWLETFYIKQSTSSCLFLFFLSSLLFKIFQ